MQEELASPWGRFHGSGSHPDREKREGWCWLSTQGTFVDTATRHCIVELGTCLSQAGSSRCELEVGR
eukprot:6487962-Amphidinium_carterae.1